MVSNRYLSGVLTFIAAALWMISLKLWLSPQEAVAEDMDIKNRLSYISKIVGSMESSMIQVQGDVRFTKRYMEEVSRKTDSMEKRFSGLESQIVRIGQSVDSLEMDVSSMDGNVAYLESDMDDLTSGSCDNIFLCRQKKS